MPGRLFKVATSALCGLGLALGVAACGDDGGDTSCSLDLAFAVGDDGASDPLGAPAGQARAGKALANDFPADAPATLTWAAGDFIIANDKVAMVIEDAGPSDLYDPWGGRPVGISRVEGGAMSKPADFGEFFVLVGRYTVVTQSVSVINDGSDGNAAKIRASGFLAPLPFFENITGGLLRDEFDGISAAIEYTLEPGAEYVDINILFRNPREQVTPVNAVLHAFMYGKRMPGWAPERGFDADAKKVPYLIFVDEDATSYAYENPHGQLGAGVSQSGFTSNITDSYEMAACAESTRHHARIYIGGPGLEGARRAMARAKGESAREITGTVRDASGAPAAGVRVHAQNTEGGYVTRAMTDANGAYSISVGIGEAVDLTAFRRGDAVVGPTRVEAATLLQDLQLTAVGTISVTATDLATAGALPVRIQVLPGVGSAVPSVPENFGEPEIVGGRIHVVYAMDGKAELQVPVGEWEVIISRGYEWEIHRETVIVTDIAKAEVTAALEHVVDTTGVMCADFHIHARRSNDSGDHIELKVRSAIADGLDIPVSSEHEYVNDFQPTIVELGMEDWAFGMASVEMSSMEIWGHMGVLPLTPDPGKVNGGTPLWQQFPSPDTMDATTDTLPVTLNPPDVFDAVRARPEEPVIIINHPRGSTNYFTYAGYDPTTGMASFPEAWDEKFKVVEVFNGSSWRIDATVVVDWLSFLNHGRRVFAVGSSDSHAISGSPVGYPRTCLEVGTDDPRALTGNIVRDATAAGHSYVSGGVYLDVLVGTAGPGDDATGVGETATVSIKVQAASWVDVDKIDVVVDGEIAQTIDILPGDANVANPAIRYEKTITVPVAAAGSYLVIAAVGDTNLDPVHPGQRSFAVTNPVFLSR